MQSQPRLQEEAVDVVINFLASQRGSYVRLPCLHAAPRYQQQMSNLLDAAAARRGVCRLYASAAYMHENKVITCKMSEWVVCSWH